MTHSNADRNVNVASRAVLGFALGAMTGAALALLVAPAAGRDTRAYLDERGRRLANDLAERGRQAADRGRHLVDRGRHLIGGQRERAIAAVERSRESVARFGDRLGEALAQGRATYRDVKREAVGLATGASSAGSFIGRRHSG